MNHPASRSQPAERRSLPPSLIRSDYVSLRTWRADGSPVECPLWFAWSVDEQTVWVRSKRDTAKVRRIAASPEVELRACGWRGAVRADALAVGGHARLLDDESDEWTLADAELHHRYGWKWNSVPLFRLPFTNTVATDMTLAAKVGHIRSGAPLPASVLIAIEIDA